VFSRARWLCSGRSLVISSALAALVAVPVVAASDALILVKEVETRPLAGGLEVKIRTTGRPSYTTYPIDAPARLAIDLEGASIDPETWTALHAENQYFERIETLPFRSRTGESVRLELWLRGSVSPEVSASDEGLLLTFFGPVETASAIAAPDESVLQLEDSSGLALHVVPQEPRAESQHLVALVDAMASGQWHEAVLIEEPLIVERTAAAPVHAAEEPALSAPILAAPRAQRIDFRELEAANALEARLGVGGRTPLPMPLLAQTPSGIGGVAPIQMEAQTQREFSGAPISLDLKNIEMVELLRIFADLSNMNIIIDPGIRGRVTVRMRDVPWDQAFVTILRNQGLGFTIEGNILRVATLRRLNAEARAEQQLREAQLVAEPLNTEIVYLNYATPNQVSRVLRSQLSRRGQILTDARTNSLIIKDVQGSINRAKRLLEILDVRTKQVAINAQIVTTSKSFTRDLGIIWGGTLIADPAFGNDTGLTFPNNITTDFGVSLPAGSQLISFNFGNVLDTVRLSAALTASEAEGITKTISNPRIVTSDNVSASVRSGSLVPYQSSAVSGNTVVATVVFREAAVSLSVTPHVTSDNYVRMRLTISSDAPNFSIATPAGPPIETNSLSTTVLVKDGDTFVIGGLNSSTEGANENRVPFLHRIPVVGRILFKNKRTSNAYDDLLMFVTPSVVQDEAVRQRALVFESYEPTDGDGRSPSAPRRNP
jgi:type IV pilus secretin PilQ/predicted competence protein